MNKLITSAVGVWSLKQLSKEFIIVVVFLFIFEASQNVKKKHIKLIIVGIIYILVC